MIVLVYAATMSIELGEVGYTRMPMFGRLAIEVPARSNAAHRSSLERTTWEALRRVRDPELGLDVVSLGLVYDVRTVDDHVCVDMTLTTPGWRVSEQLPVDAAVAVARALPEHHVVDVRVVCHPRWTVQRLSPDAMSRLGYRS
jgi:metal-sulfur cluster biosynthetic enzyme